MADKPHVNENTLRTMQELLRQPPKQHSEMKVGKTKAKKAVSPKRAPRKSRAK